MLKDEIVLEALHLLEQGLSRRQVALRLGVSHATVNAIAQGRRRVEPPQPEPEPTGAYHRCPECGYKVELPCVACRARSYARRQPFQPQLGPPPLKLVAAMSRPVRRPGRPPRQVA